MHFLEAVDCSDIKKNLADDFEKEIEQPIVEPIDLQRDHMCVYLRVRPLLAQEKKKGEDQVWMMQINAYR